MLKTKSIFSLSNPEKDVKEELKTGVRTHNLLSSFLHRQPLWPMFSMVVSLLVLIQEPQQV